MTRHQRRGERGQVLVLALAFIAFFGLVVGAILNYAGSTGTQHVHTEKTATSDSRIEGGAAYAAADANRVNLPAGQSLPAIDCIGEGNTSGSLTMGDGSTVTYATQNCNPGTSSSGGGLPGTPCILCVLNDVATPFDASRVVLTDDQTLTVNGEIDVNGSVDKTKPKELIQSVGDPPFFAPAFNIMGACPTPAKGKTLPNCVPTPRVYTNPISNPLPVCAVGPCATGTLAAPTGLTPKTASCSSPALTPGIYDGISGSGSCNYTMASGIYVLTAPLSFSGSAQITGTGVTIYLACSNFPTPCAGGGGTSGIGITGNGVTSISPPTSGPYNGVVVFADPTMTGTLLSDQGNGDSFAGTVVLPMGDLNVGGGGTGNGVTIDGRLIADTVTSIANGKVGSGLTLDGKLFTMTSSCTVFDDTVTWTKGSANNTGRAIIQQQCPGTGLVHLGYSP